MKLYIIKMLDGSVRIMTLISGTVESEYAKWTDAADVVSSAAIDLQDIPTDRYFRDGWALGVGDTIDFDLTKCKDIQLVKIRAVRDAKLRGLDEEMFRAIDQIDNEKQTELATERQRLRDITEPLKDLIPTTLQEIIDAFPAEFLL